MYQVPKYEPSVTVFSVSGGVWVYPSLKALYKEVGIRWLREKLGADFCVFEGFDCWMEGDVWRREPRYTTAQFIARDDLGRKLTSADFEGFRPAYRSRRYWRYGQWNGEGPVPGTGRSTWSYVHRRPKTTQERRLSQPMEGEPAPRAKRNSANLPNSWDDYGKSSYGNHNWKRHRKTQWKA